MQEARDKARAGARAAEEIATFSEEKIDFILQNMVRVAEANKVMLAEMAHKETGLIRHSRITLHRLCSIMKLRT